MEAVIFCGVQATGKSTFFRERFFDTHVRINLDMLRTRHREALFLRACVEAKQPFVVDNTNPTAAERATYIAAALAGGFRVVGYYFACVLDAALERNDRRPLHQRVPRAGILGTYKRLELPSPAEGFDELNYVKWPQTGGFIIKAWRDEV